MTEHNPTPRRWRWLLYLIRGAAITLVIWLLVVALLLLTIDRVGEIDGAAPADVIIVLGAGVQRDGSAGYALTRRAERAAMLWQMDYAPLLICSGGQAPGFPRSEAEACRDVLLRSGVPSDAVLLERRSTSTEENAIFSGELMREQGLQRALVVSDSFHIYRAGLIFAHYGVDAAFSPVPLHHIRGYPNYNQSMLREVAALHWWTFKTLLGLPATSFP